MRTATLAPADCPVMAGLPSLAAASRIFTQVLPSTRQRPVPTWWAMEEEPGFEGGAQGCSTGNAYLSHAHKLLAGFIQAWSKWKSSCVQDLLLRTQR